MTNIQYTTPQKKLLHVLQDEENRSLSISELCKKAGYRSTRAWYRVCRDSIFKKQLNTLRIGIVHKAVPLAENADEEWLKDTIDLRRLISDYPKHRDNARFRLNFTYIHNITLRNVVKRYFRNQIGIWEAYTFMSSYRGMIPFFDALSKAHPHVETFSQISRIMIEPLLTISVWTDSKDKIHPISSSRKYYMIAHLDKMFSYMVRHEWEEAPQRALIYPEDRPKVKKLKPRPIPKAVFEQLQRNIHLLTPYARNLVEIISVTGLRAMDALHLTEDCLEYDASGEPRLRWYNYKLKRDGRLLPITTNVAEAIFRQKELVKEIPEHYERRYLFRNRKGLYRFATFCKNLNDVAERVRILGEDGQVYRFKPHAFRHMVGTHMINNGMGIVDVMTYLDHRSPEMTLRYAEINDETLKQKFKATVMSNQTVGGTALKELKKQLEAGDERELDWIFSNLRKNSLPWGHCLHHAKANRCPYGQNVCFTKDNGPCNKLVTTPAHAPVIKSTMEDLKKSKKAADENGWEMYSNDLAEQVNGMQKVLAELEQPETQRPLNRGGTNVEHI